MPRVANRTEPTVARLQSSLANAASFLNLLHSEPSRATRAFIGWLGAWLRLPRPPRFHPSCSPICSPPLLHALSGQVSAEMMKQVVIAYEPVWAIGTGLTATPEIAQETHAYIRSWFVDNYSQEVADAVIIQYGGSVNPANVDSLMACPDIDGALVGGASLKKDTFGPIINFTPA